MANRKETEAYSMLCRACGEAAAAPCRTAQLRAAWAWRDVPGAACLCATHTPGWLA